MRLPATELVTSAMLGTLRHSDRGPDLERGVRISDPADGGMLAGHVGDDAVLPARKGDELFALDAFCPHYHAPLVRKT